MPSQTTLAILWLLKALIELIVIGVFVGMFGLVGIIPMLTGDKDGLLIGSIFVILSVVVGGIFVVLSIPTLIIALGFLRGTTWGKIGILILSAFNLMHMPFGTILSVLTFLSLKDLTKGWSDHEPRS